MTPPAEQIDEDFHFQVSCPVDRALLAVLRRFIVNIAEDMGFAPEDIYQIEMAVDEACSNVVLHAYGSEGGLRGASGIELKLKLAPDVLTIHVQDRGRGGEPAHFAGAPSLDAYEREDREEYCGLGILIMKQFMDEVLFRAEPSKGTQVLLRKFLKDSPDAPRSSA